MLMPASGERLPSSFHVWVFSATCPLRSLNVLPLLCPACPSGPDSFPAVLNVAVGLSSAVSSSFHKERVEGAALGDLEEVRVDVVLTHLIRQSISTVFTKWPLNYKEIFRRITDKRPCFKSYFMLLFLQG